MKSETIETITSRGLCSGCGACAVAASGRIEMRLTEEGFLRPAVRAPLSAEQEGVVRDVCPGRRMDLFAGDRTDHPLWGPLVSVREGHASDVATRHAGSSGGVLTALLTHLLESGGVDRVLQTGADTARPYANATVLSDDEAAVLAAAGSRYAPSAPLAGLEEVLALPGKTAFVGKPCDVAGLRALARRDARIDAKIPYMLSFFCAGVPSLAGAREVLQRMQVDEADLASFRYRGNGWPGYATAERRDGARVRMTYAESWGGVLSSHLQFRCKICPDGTGMFADVVCADAWACDDKGYPTFEEGDGISLILCRTRKGEDLVHRARGSRRIAAHIVSAEKIAAMQPGQLRRKQAALVRIAAHWLFTGGGVHFTGFQLVRSAMMAKWTSHLREFAGTVRRLWRARRSKWRRIPGAVLPGVREPAEVDGTAWPAQAAVPRVSAGE